MPSSASPLKLRFILDENVNKSLGKFLSAQGYQVDFALKGMTNGKLAALSKLSKSILVTNDSDFSDPLRYSGENVFSIIWLAIPQQKPDVLLAAFNKLLNDKQKVSDFEGNLIKLTEHKYEIQPLFNTRGFR